MKMMDNDTGPVPRRYSDAGSVERLVGVRASRYASGRPGLRRAGESGAGGKHMIIYLFAKTIILGDSESTMVIFSRSVHHEGNRFVKWSRCSSERQDDDL